jgi:carbon monoxide dehydrogenase subunit G
MPIPAVIRPARERPEHRRAPAALATLALLVSAAVAAIAPGPARAQPASAPSPATIAVTREGGNYYVDASLFTTAPPAVAWEVLTDFDHMAAFVPNLERSRAIVRSPNRVTLQQRGVARFGPLAFPFESEREIEVVPIEIIRSRQTRGSMRHLLSLTTLAPDGTGTRIDYHVEVDPGALYPAFLTQTFLRDEINEQFLAIEREMRRRAAAK